jgi:hypothetical protein
MIENKQESPGKPALPRRSNWRKVLLAGLGLATMGGILLLLLMFFQRPAKPILLSLGDGRILQIEGVSYGTMHRIGRTPLFKQFQPWLPVRLAGYFAPSLREDEITLDRPGLVVWVSAVSESGKTNVDCQGIRVEFMDRNGDRFGQSTSAWHGGANFWRTAHVFYCFPREERDLTLCVTSWKNGKTSSTKIPNPIPTLPAIWKGDPLPQARPAGGLEMHLTKLVLQTNGQGRKSYYETATRYYEPVVEILENGKPAGGWDKPEWFAESPNGNSGQFLGVHQPVLRFVITVYPEATNRVAAPVIATLPRIDLSALATNQWWNLTNHNASNTVVALGIFPGGTHTFSEGVYESSTAKVNGPVGGARSGWTGRSQQITPFKRKVTRNHYAPVPVIYLHVANDMSDPFDGNRGSQSESPARYAVRLRDDQGNYWVTKPEDAANGIRPFLVELPSSVTNVVPEIVLLKPIKADFIINTK